MLFRLGRGLQLAGMIVAPVGVAGNVVRPEQVSVQDSLSVAAVGVALFASGWLLQQVARPK
jgi:hypothetical protein